MFSYFEHLRHQPLATRKKIALMVAGGVTFVIFVFWVSGLFSGKPVPLPANVAEKKGPIEAMGETIGTLFSDVSKTVSGIKEVFSLSGAYTATNTATVLEGVSNNGISE